MFRTSFSQFTSYYSVCKGFGCFNQFRANLGLVSARFSRSGFQPISVSFVFHFGLQPTKSVSETEFLKLEHHGRLYPPLILWWVASKKISNVNKLIERLSSGLEHTTHIISFSSLFLCVSWLGIKISSLDLNPEHQYYSDMNCWIVIKF